MLLRIKKENILIFSPGLIKLKCKTKFVELMKKKISSVKKFKLLNKKNKVPLPDEVAENILNTIYNLKNKNNGGYLDIRKK